MSQNLEERWIGKTALITGASSGIGAATARLLASKGLRVILAARREDRLLELKKEINDKGGSAETYPIDLVVEQAREKCVNNILQSFGCPDILINNAGLGWYGWYSQMPWEINREIVNLNVLAVTHLTRLFLPEMLKLERARVINVGSVSGKLPEQGIAIYSASKSFLDSFTTVLYREYRHTNLRVSVIRAGPVKTEFFDQARSLRNGGNVPAEKLAVPALQVAEGIWNTILHPTRVRYIPFYLFLSPLLEVFFAPVIDLIGPVLLKRKLNAHNNPN